MLAKVYAIFRRGINLRDLEAIVRLRWIFSENSIVDIYFQGFWIENLPALNFSSPPMNSSPPPTSLNLKSSRPPSSRWRNLCWRARDERENIRRIPIFLTFSIIMWSFWNFKSFMLFNHGARDGIWSRAHKAGSRAKSQEGAAKFPRGVYLLRRSTSHPEIACRRRKNLKIWWFNRKKGQSWG